MTAHLVLARPGARAPDERSVVIADGLAPLAFLAPVIWLLFNRLWLEAFAAGLVLSAATMLAVDQPALGLAVSLGLSLITALEGRNWRAAALQRRGWQLVDVVDCDDPDTAFEIHAVHAMERAPAPLPGGPAPARSPFGPVSPARGESGSIGLVPVGRN